MPHPASVEELTEENEHLRQIVVAFLQRCDNRAVFIRGELLAAADPHIMGEIEDRNAGSLTIWTERSDDRPA